MGLMHLCDEQPERETAFLSELLLSGIKLHKELCSSRVWILIPVTGFLVVAYPASLLSLVHVFLSSVSVSCSYPSCRLCLPLHVSFLVVRRLLAVRRALVSPVLVWNILFALKANQWLYSCRIFLKILAYLFVYYSFFFYFTGLIGTQRSMEIYAWRKYDMKWYLLGFRIDHWRTGLWVIFGYQQETELFDLFTALWSEHFRPSYQFGVFLHQINVYG